MMVSEFKTHCLAVLKEIHASGRPLCVTLRGKSLVEIRPASPSPAHVVRLGARPGRAEIRVELERVDFADDWEIAP